MDDIGKIAKKLYEENVNSFIEHIRVVVGNINPELENKYIEEYNEAMHDFANYLLAAFPEEKLGWKQVNYWLNEGANLSFAHLYRKNADKIFLQQNNAIKGVIYINKSIGKNAPRFYVNDGKITDIADLNYFIVTYPQVFMDGNRAKIDETHFLGRDIEEVYEELETLGVLEERSGLRYVITIHRMQNEIFHNFHMSVIYTLLMREGGSFDVRRAMLYDKFVNLGFDFETIYEKNYLMSLQKKQEESKK